MVSIAEAKNHLPALVHDAEKQPIILSRRGRPVGVLLSHERYEALLGSGGDAWTRLQSWRQAHDVDSLELASAFDDVRDKTPGRAFRW